MTMFNNVQYLFWHNQSPKAWKVHEKTAWDELQIEVFAHLASQGELLPAALQCTCPVSKYGASCYFQTWKSSKWSFPDPPSLDPLDLSASCATASCPGSWCHQIHHVFKQKSHRAWPGCPHPPCSASPVPTLDSSETPNIRSRRPTASTTALRVRQPEANLSGPTASIIHQNIQSDHEKKKLLSIQTQRFHSFSTLEAPDLWDVECDIFYHKSPCSWLSPRLPTQSSRCRPNSQGASNLPENALWLCLEIGSTML